MNRSREHVCWCAAAIVAGGLGFAVSSIGSGAPRGLSRPLVERGSVESRLDGHPPSNADRLKNAAAPADLGDALKSPGALNRAQCVFAAISSMNAADFRCFASKPERLANLECFPIGDFQNAVWDAFVARWLEVDPGAAEPTIFGAAGHLLKRQLVGGSELMDAMARVKPEAILATFSDKNSAILSSYGIVNAIYAAFGALSQRDPAEARKYLDACPAEQRGLAESVIAGGIARKDPVAGASLAIDLKDANILNVALESAEDIGPGMVREVVEAASGKIPFDRRFARFVLAHPELPWSHGATEPAAPA